MCTLPAAWSYKTKLSVITTFRRWGVVQKILTNTLYQRQTCRSSKGGILPMLFVLSETQVLNKAARNCRVSDRKGVSQKFNPSGAQAVWANKKYHGHCTLPHDFVVAVK